MQVLIDTVLPIFGLILIGYLTGRFSFISSSGIKGLSDFVFYFAIPALLFSSIARGVDLASLDWRILVVYYLACLVTFLVTQQTGRWVFRIPPAERVVMGMGAMFSNTVMLGIPLIPAVFGEAGLLILMIIISVHALILVTACTILVEIHRNAASRGWLPAAFSTLQAMQRNPIILSVVAGIAYQLLDLPWPNALQGFTKLLGQAVAPCALFALGATLASFRIAGNLAESLAVTLIKLVLLPGLVFLFARYLFELPELATAVLTVTAALPTGANAFILAKRYNIYLQRTSAAVLISTGVSLLSLSLIVTWLL
jgi:predicted permease